LKFAVSTFFGDANRGKIFGINNASGLVSPKISIAPCDGGANGLRRISLTMRSGGEHPADFGQVLQGAFDIAFIIGEPDLAYEITRRLFFDRPIAEAEQRPMTRVTQESGPSFLFGKSLTAEVASYNRIGPHGGAGRKIIQAMPPQF
jgi:hypothetical protein